MKPSDLREVYWDHTYKDLVTIVRLNTEGKVAELGQHFDNLATVVSKALGGSDDDDADEDVTVIESWDDLAAAFRTLGGQVGA
ncbi:hypothetical protein [Mesorhizobium sp. B2-4-1]|uniref:hypothetical protein n=1 Tax=Mesorhizobium sp. B2-4-1 TaxID=2589948 RepID=UPI001128A598|nr:hypothetical protein [Mesorhizobium sp. B2-4-1]TPL66621.1 hypothetical protein FJ949_09660 [Mesorhizobium sp. B2-4-1]